MNDIEKTGTKVTSILCLCSAYLELGRFPKDPLVTGELLPQLPKSGVPAVVGTDQREPPLLGDGRRAAVHAVRRCPEHGELITHFNQNQLEMAAIR